MMNKHFFYESEKKTLKSAENFFKSQIQKKTCAAPILLVFANKNHKIITDFKKHSANLLTTQKIPKCLSKPKKIINWMEEKLQKLN